MIRTLLAAVAVLQVAWARSIADYKCSFCKATVDHAYENDLMFKQACHELFPTEVCGLFTNDFAVTRPDPSGYCELYSFCPLSSDEKWRQYEASTVAPPDIRVAKAYGSRGYDKVRVSVISNSSIASEYFDYSEQFKYRWTGNVLNTGIVTINPGQKNNSEYCW